MKTYGKVMEYNGTFGNIKGIDGNDYVLLNKNVIDKNIKASNNVVFEGESLETPEVKINIARFVKILKK